MNSHSGGIAEASRSALTIRMSNHPRTRQGGYIPTWGDLANSIVIVISNINISI